MQQIKRNIKLIIAYDGSNYLGWQKTHTGPSIGQTLQEVIEQVLQESVTLQAASRTDAGVHAYGQVVNFFSEKLNMDIDRFRYSLNCLLPKDIVVRQTKLVTENFHPTLHCSGKEYRYSICNSDVQLPNYRLYSWHCPHLLDRNAMRAAADALTGRHDFSALCNVKKNSRYEDYVREVTGITFRLLPENRLEISVSGNHFLYKMVRNIVGTLVYVGKGMISPESIHRILANRDRTQAGITAPAHGLSLHSIHY